MKRFTFKIISLLAILGFLYAIYGPQKLLSMGKSYVNQAKQAVGIVKDSQNGFVNTKRGLTRSITEKFDKTISGIFR